jgi:uncharacterized membrane protein|eukprot:CAMPEP_0198297574 /NCGR_PEP_ID=MMETSP1449-20131203/37278_1 /TAXON_ID=420275 /ORGANISM="Attheya septentrionalis, Strain CCMP2084" /LENGTH=271 /DNA_ID=CAMNT_0043998541 /DNA_START=134 /DNA_END=949 /DNA_ORIENTATION=-
MTKSSYNRTRAALLVVALPFGVSAFSGVGQLASILPAAQSSLRPGFVGSSPARTSQLFVTTSSTDVEDFAVVNKAVIREIEQKMEKLNKKKNDALARLNKAEQTLAQLQQKKNEYMAGAQIAQVPDGGNFSETAVRSIVKAFAWRIIAGSVTFITSLRFSGSMRTALTIVGSDFFSKAATMFIGERLMNKSQAGRTGGADDVGRSLMKALLWRVFAIANTLTMAIFISKDITMASKIAGSDAIFKTGLMFFYERVWAKIEWGKDYLIEFSI